MGSSMLQSLHSFIEKTVHCEPTTVNGYHSVSHRAFGTGPLGYGFPG